MIGFAITTFPGCQALATSGPRHFPATKVQASLRHADLRMVERESIWTFLAPGWYGSVGRRPVLALLVLAHVTG